MFKYTCDGNTAVSHVAYAFSENPRTAGSETAMIPTQLVIGESVGKVKA